MRQLVREQAPALGRRGLVAARPEHDVAPHRVGERVDGPGRLRSPSVGVHAYLAEIVPEPRLHERARGRVERLAGQPQHVVHDRRCGHAASGRALRLPVEGVVVVVLVPVLARRAGSLEHVACRLWGGAVPRGGWLFRAHHAIGHLVGLDLERVARAADRELRLGSDQRAGRLVAEGPLHAHRPCGPLLGQSGWQRPPVLPEVGRHGGRTGPLAGVARGVGAAPPLLFFPLSVGRL